MDRLGVGEGENIGVGSAAQGPNVGISPEGDALTLVMVHLRRQTRELADDFCTTRIQHYLDRCRSRA